MRGSSQAGEQPNRLSPPRFRPHRAAGDVSFVLFLFPPHRVSSLYYSDSSSMIFPFYSLCCSAFLLDSSAPIFIFPYPPFSPFSLLYSRYFSSSSAPSHSPFPIPLCPLLFFSFLLSLPHFSLLFFFFFLPFRYSHLLSPSRDAEVLRGGSVI